MSEADVIAALAGFLSADKQTRESASAQLVQFVNVEGYLTLLLQILNDQSQSNTVRIAAATQFKSVSGKRWELSKDPKVAALYTVVSAEEKAQLRPNLLGSLITGILPIRNVLEDTLRAIVTIDFPEHWPTLGDEVMGALVSDSQQQVMAALIVLRAILRRFQRFEEDDLKTKSHDVGNAVLPTLRNLLDYTLQNDSVEAQEVQLLVLKVFFDITTYGLPPLLYQHDVFDSWMRGLMAVFSAPVPMEGLSPDDIESLPWWKTKKWTIHFWIRFCNRFMRKAARKQADTDAFRTFFSGTYPMIFLEKAFEGLMSISQGSPMPARLIVNLLDFLVTCVQFGQLWTHIKPHVWDIIKNVFIPLISFNEAKATEFEYEPERYISQQLDPMEDSTDPAIPCISFLVDIISNRQGEWLQQIMGYVITDIFQPYNHATPEAKLELANLKYAGLDIFGHLKRFLVEEDGLKDTVEEVLVSFVIPDMTEAVAPWLRAKACWVASRFMRLEFSSDEVLVSSMNGMLHNFLNATEMPLVADAGVGLFDLIPQPVARPILGPLVHDLVHKYLSLIAHVDNDAIVGSLQYLMRHFKTPIRRVAPTLLANLVSAFLRSFTNANNQDDGTLVADNSFMAASQTIRAITTLYKTIRQSPHLYAPLEPLIMPAMKHCLSENGISYMEDITGVLVEITYHSPTPFSADLWKTFVWLSEAYLSFAPDYMQSMLPTFDNFLSRDKESFMAPGAPYLGLICSFAEKYYADAKFAELDIFALNRLFEVLLLEYVGHLDHILEHLLKLAVGRLALGGSEPFKVVMCEFVLNCMWNNAALAVHVLEANGYTQDVLKTLFDLIVEDQFERVCDKKTAALGIGAMLRLGYDNLPPYAQSKFMEIVITWMQLTQQSEDQQLAEMEEAEADDEEFEEAEEEGEEGEDAEEEDEGDWGADDDVLSEGMGAEEEELAMQEAFADLKAAQNTENDLLDDDDLAHLQGQPPGKRGDTQDLPEYVGLDQDIPMEAVLNYGNAAWTLAGQEESDELPTKDTSEVVYLAETFELMNPDVRDQLFAQFPPEMQELYTHLSEVASDKLQKIAFEQERAAAKAAKRADLAAYYAQVKAQQQQSH